MAFLAETLTTETLVHGLHVLAGRDPDLGEILHTLGPPPLWAREPGFPTLLHIILEQQVSLASARAAFDRLRAAVDPLTPERFLELDDDHLKTIGFSRQKTRYGRHLAQAILDGQLDLEAFQCWDDTAVHDRLLQLKGIGPWTADIYLLMALCRPDIWPVGDLALVTAVQEIKHLAQRPGAQEMETIAAAWRPWRAVAARLLWHHYLSK